MQNGFIFIAIIFTAISCTSNIDKKNSKQKGLVENTLDFVTEHKDNSVIELSSIYDSLTSTIADDSAEYLILADSLKKRGFKVIDWSRGNHPRGPRFVNLVLQKDNCFCEVTKLYYSSFSDDWYEMSEKVSCSDSVTYYKRRSK